MFIKAHSGRITSPGMQGDIIEAIVFCIGFDEIIQFLSHVLTTTGLINAQIFNKHGLVWMCVGRFRTVKYFTEAMSDDLTFIVFPDGQTMMIDAGAPFCEERVLNFVKALKIQNLDYFVLTHPHGDHYGCALAAVKHLSEKKNGCVRRFLYTGYKAAKDEFKALLDYLSDKGTEMNTHVREGDKFDVGGVRIDVFNPDDAVLAVDTKGDDVVNNTSISMKFTFGEASFIASGDLYAGRERALAEKYGDFLRADFIKSNHHGLFTSNTAEWIAAACPKYILTEDDGADWTLFEDRLKKQKIRHFRVSEKGLVCATVSRDGKYRFSTEY